MNQIGRIASGYFRTFSRRIQFTHWRSPLVALFVLFGLIAIATFATTGYAERFVNKLGLMQNKRSVRLRPTMATLKTDKGTYLAAEEITLTGTNWAAGEAVTITITAQTIKGLEEMTQVTADKTGSFTATMTMPDSRASESAMPTRSTKGVSGAGVSAAEESDGIFTATATGSSSKAIAAGIADRDGERLLAEEGYWIHRLSYPTGRFVPQWVRRAAEQDAGIPRRVPAGRKLDIRSLKDNPLALSPIGFTALGPQPERMTGCTGCFDYTTTAGRINDIKIDPVSANIAYAASVGGGVWKTTNCCSGSTSWNAVTDDALVSTTSIDSVAIDPNNHNTIYAGTGDLNYGSFSMGSQGILKSTDAGASWTVLGATGNMKTPGRYDNTAVVFASGNTKILAAGGYNGSSYTNTAEIFDSSQLACLRTS